MIKYFDRIACHYHGSISRPSAQIIKYSWGKSKHCAVALKWRKSICVHVYLQETLVRTLYPAVSQLDCFLELAILVSKGAVLCTVQ